MTMYQSSGDGKQRETRRPGSADGIIGCFAASRTARPKSAWSKSASTHGTKRTTDHYAQWYDNKSCSSSRISSGNLKESMLGNIEVPTLYTAVTPKSFLPPSPLRTKQFVMPLKLQQLEPQKKPPVNSDLTVTFVHRKMSDATSKSCLRNNGSNGTTTRPSKNSNTNKQTNKPTVEPAPPPQATYLDPVENAPISFINRLAEMTAHQTDTVRVERTKRGKNRTRIS